jgi:hypothetical protein
MDFNVDIMLLEHPAPALAVLPIYFPETSLLIKYGSRIYLPMPGTPALFMQSSIHAMPANIRS